MLKRAPRVQVDDGQVGVIALRQPAFARRAEQAADRLEARIRELESRLEEVEDTLAAIRRGEFVSDDTLFDIGVYVRMVQRMRETGNWP